MPPQSSSTEDHIPSMRQSIAGQFLVSPCAVLGAIGRQYTATNKSLSTIDSAPTIEVTKRNASSLCDPIKTGSAVRDTDFG